MASREQMWIPWRRGSLPKDYGVKRYEMDMSRCMWRPKLLSPGVTRPRPPKQLTLF